jgi:heptosyltransferase-3
MTAPALRLPARGRILVVALRRLGDVLLTTPLIRSLRRAWPDATIEVLVFADTAGILDGNPDIDRVIAIPARPTLRQSLAYAAALLKRYHLAVSTQSGDRPTGFALLAGRTHIGPTWPGNRIKRFLLGRSVPAGEGVHRVEEMLRIADVLGIARVAEVVAPAGASPPAVTDAAAYAVIHAAPKFRYKQWTREGWRSLAEALTRRGLAVVATGGPDERGYLDELWRDAPAVRRLDGCLTWPELAALLARASVYVGPDTSVTHLAAASGCPTVALFGPTDPRLWGPWPAQGLDTPSEAPWATAGTIQRRGNVWLVQNPLPCLPCQQEGCDRHLQSHARCLDELTPRQVLTAVDQALARQSEMVAP